MKLKFSLLLLLYCPAYSMDKTISLNEQLCNLLKEDPDASVEQVTALVEAGADVTQEIERDTPLLITSGQGNIPVCEYLLSQNVSVNGTNERGDSPLMLAAYNGKVVCLAYLIAKGAEVNQATKKGVTALHWACCRGKELPVALLLEHDADPNFRKNVRSPLSHAIEAGSAVICDLLLTAGADPYVAGYPTVMCKLFRHDRPEVCAVFKKHDILLEGPIGEKKKSVLHFLCWSGTLEQVKRAIWYGVKICARDVDGSTPLHYAAYQGKVAIVEYLSLLVSPNLLSGNRGEPEETPLMFAAKKGHTEACQALIKRKANVHYASSDWGQTALHLAAHYAHPGVCKVLLDAGAQPKVKDLRGVTPLGYAAVKNHVDTCRFLLQRGASLEPNAKGVSAFSRAVEAGSLEVCELFYAYRSKAFERCYGGSSEKVSLFGLAIRSEKPLVCRLFITRSLSIPTPKQATGLRRVINVLTRKLDKPRIIRTLLMIGKRRQVPKDVVYLIITKSPELCDYLLYALGPRIAQGKPYPIRFIPFLARAIASFSADSLRNQVANELCYVTPSREIRTLLDPNLLEETFGEDMTRYAERTLHERNPSGK